MIDPGFAQEQVDTLDRLIEAALDDVETDLDALAAVRRRALMRFQYLTALDSAEAPEAAVVASQAANAAFTRTCKREDTVRCTIKDREVELTVLGPNHHATPLDWLTAAWLAVISGSEQRVDELCAVGKYALRGSGVRTDDYVHPWVETVQRFLSGEPVPPRLLESVIDLTDPERAGYATREFMLLIAYPQANLLYRALRGTAEQFAQARESASNAHHDYWRHKDDPDGIIPLAVRAISIRAERGRSAHGPRG